MPGSKAILFFLFSLAVSAALSIITYLSPLNQRRPTLIQAKYIVLHTTEGGAKGSLSKLYRLGEAHFMIDTHGQIYRLIDEDKVARHSGRSLWNGRTGIDDVSIGIEIVGIHSKPITAAQEKALAGLLRELKSRHHIRDENILTHSMVAAAVPNKYHPNYHRGRKRCGMLFGTKEFRSRVGIGPGPKNDPDVVAGRIGVADPFLYSILFNQNANAKEIVEKVYNSPNANIISKNRSAWFIARGKYNHVNTIYTLPNQTKVRGSEITDWSSLPVGTRVTYAGDVQLGTSSFYESESVNESFEFKEIGKHGTTAYQIARGEYASSTTIYFLPDRRVFTGQELNKDYKQLLGALPKGTNILVGYVNGGFVSKHRPAYQITGRLWNSPATIYRLPDGKIVTGDDVNPNAIPYGTFVFFEK